MTYKMDGQVSLFDLGIPSGRMSREPEVQTAERTTGQCWKNFAGCGKQTLQYLDLRSGRSQGSSLGTVGVLLTEKWMPNTLVYRSGGEELQFYVISEDIPHRTFCLLNPSDKPIIPVESHLSWVLQSEVDERFNLSKRACEGILSRASRRGKALPEILLKALKSVIHSNSGTPDQSAEGGIRAIDSDESLSDSGLQSRPDTFLTDRNRQ